jgi:hypothetical protein
LTRVALQVNMRRGWAIKSSTHTRVIVMENLFWTRIAAIVVALAFAMLPESAPVANNALAAETGAKVERFDNDPGWEGLKNRIRPKNPKQVEQKFAYSPTNIAGKAQGEIGGTIWRDSKLAWYADKISPKTLDDRLTASGTFALTATSGSSGAFFGWFKEQEGNGRQNTLGFRLAGQGSGARITFQLVTAKNQACGTKITPWVVDKSKPRGQGRKYRPPSIKNDGTRYTWHMEYDPEANDDNGQMRFTIRSNRDQREEFEGKTFTVDLPEGYKDHGTTFDRFGFTNSMRPGNSLTIYFDDIEYDGVHQDFSADPNWIGVNNHARYERKEEGGAHDFGFSQESSFAGGSPGELGGMLWRSGEYAYYADRVGPLSLEDRLEARGRVVLEVGPPDSGMHLGWFNGAEREFSPPQAGSFVGVKIGGPTRVGHYFVPSYATRPAQKVTKDPMLQHPKNISVERGTGPVLEPRKKFDWKLVYDPEANDGGGAITVTLGDESVTLPLKPGDKAKGAQFDRFGLFTVNRGGSFVRIYFDDLAYTAESPQ